MKVEARVSTTYRAEGHVVSPCGRELYFDCHDSLRSWWAIFRWNLHFRHWSAVRTNLRDLPRYLWRNIGHLYR